MIVRLTDKCWNFIMDGLHCLAEDHARQAKDLGDNSLSETAEEIRALAQTLESLGQDVVGGRVEGFRMKASIRSKDLPVEIRVAPDKDS